MNDRIRQLQLDLNMSQKDFADAIGITPGALSNIYSNRTNATSNHVKGIHKAFPRVNVNWLMFGEGDMYLADATVATDEAGLLSSEDEGAVSVPLVGSNEKGDLFAALDQANGGRLTKRATDVRVGGQRDVAVGGVTFEGYANRSAQTMPDDYNAKKVDTIRRKIKEIRVFFDDGTYETFTPGK
ncbi:MAG: helix-turn-helix domain-containing protein [Bacteroidaceae bacterium]